MERFFIRDARNNVAGNPKGYPTHKGAERQMNTKSSKAFKQVWNTFNEVEDELDAKGVDKRDRLIYKIKGESV